MCVQACPTGIDIRKGLQYECITCASCIDACDAVMDRFGYPRGLIRYTTQNALQGKGHARAAPADHRLRPAARRRCSPASSSRWPTAPPCTSTCCGTGTRCTASCRTARIENVYQLKILNKDDKRARRAGHRRWPAGRTGRDRAREPRAGARRRAGRRRPRQRGPRERPARRQQRDLPPGERDRRRRSRRERTARFMAPVK